MSNFKDQATMLTHKMLTMENLWRLAKFEPNKEQAEAINHIDGPLYLTAGPGSGKTRVLLWRTVNLIVFHDIKPEEIFLSTFTEKAALQLKQGLQSLLGIVTNLNGQPYDLSQMYIGTVHSLCHRMLSDRRHFAAERQRNRPPQTLDELGQYFHLARNRTWREILTQAGLTDDNAASVINAIFGNNSESKHLAVTSCLSIFNRFSEECIDPTEAIQSLQNRYAEVVAYFEAYDLIPDRAILLLRLYAAYVKSLQVQPNARLTDFALLQQEAFKVLEQLAGAGNVFKHLIVDEYQDTNTIQEKIFFRLAQGTHNICVVGDDDQALYRFRGATVENFVEFPTRCRNYLGVDPKPIPLNTNYRSRKTIVDFYNAFMQRDEWAKPNGGAYRVTKKIGAARKDGLPAVVASAPDKPVNVCAEIARTVKQLIVEGKVENANQIAFLYPSLKYQGGMTDQVRRMKLALENEGLQVYAPRAARFLEVDEGYDVFGLLFQILGRPSGFEFRGRDYTNFLAWVTQAETVAQQLMEHDPRLAQYVRDRRQELETARSDYQSLLKVVEQQHWDLKAPYQHTAMSRLLHGATGLSDQAKKQLASTYLGRLTQQRTARGVPFSLFYALKRVTSIDWNILDVFYRLCMFEHFKKMFDAAEHNGDEGPVANLGLITQYLARFVEERVPLITADLLAERMLQTILFSYLFALYRLGETELEDADDPFPKGRIPFLTIHQAKGLEFPVVVLGNPRKKDDAVNILEVLTRPLMAREPGEPLDLMARLDVLRMFYVALSRAKNLLIIAHYKGPGQSIHESFTPLLVGSNISRLSSFDLKTVPKVEVKNETLPKAYSFTADYLNYRKCPRQYMIFRKFGFVASRSQTMFFGSLVHRTLEDLHHELIRRKANP